MTECETNAHATAVLAERISSEEKLRCKFEKFCDERDVRYQKQFEASEKAVFAALAAQEKLTTGAFSASERAIEKAEAAQKDYNLRSNEFRGQLDDQAKLLMSRTECLSKFESFDARHSDMRAHYDKEIADLRESRSVGSGRSAGISASWAFLIALVGAAGGIIALGSMVFNSRSPAVTPVAPIVVPATSIQK